MTAGSEGYKRRLWKSHVPPGRQQRRSSSPGTGRCRSCGKPVLWAETQRGRKMPLDLPPADDGNVRIVDGVAVLVPPGTAPDPDWVLYHSHFETCPKADDWRRR